VLEAGDRGEVGIWRRDADRWMDLVPWTVSAAVRPDAGPNVLTVRAVGPELTFEVNGAEVARVVDETLGDGRVGTGISMTSWWTGSGCRRSTSSGPAPSRGRGRTPPSGQWPPRRAARREDGPGGHRAPTELLTKHRRDVRLLAVAVGLGVVVVGVLACAAPAPPIVVHPGAQMRTTSVPTVAMEAPEPGQFTAAPEIELPPALSAGPAAAPQAGEMCRDSQRIERPAEHWLCRAIPGAIPPPRVPAGEAIEPD
jgi:hypothetical protein